MSNQRYCCSTQRNEHTSRETSRENTEVAQHCCLLKSVLRSASPVTQYNWNEFIWVLS